MFAATSSNRIKVALVVICAAGLAVTVGADPLDVPPPVTWAWSPPTDGAPVHHYEVDLSVNDGPYALRAVTYDTTFTLVELEYMNRYEIRVRGITSEGVSGPSSAESEAYVPDLPEPPRIPGG